MYDSHISTLAIPSSTASPCIDRHLCAALAAAKQERRETAREARHTRRAAKQKKPDGEETEPAGLSGALAYFFGR